MEFQNSSFSCSWFRKTHGSNSKHFDIKKTIGKGSYGKVYSCVSRISGSKFALKIMPKERLLAENISERVVNEIEIHCQLDHPNIVKLYDSFEDEEYVYLVLELCESGNMSEYIKKWKYISESESKYYITQLMAGLQYLHSHGIIHRDLKLSNILIRQDMTIKIADFGLATVLGSPQEACNTMCGTPNYMSPELASSQSYSFPADMWSVGCILFHFLTGRSPFQSKSFKQILKKVKKGMFTMPEHISNEASDLICKLLQKNPRDRCTIDDVLNHPFITGQRVSNDETKSKNQTGEMLAPLNTTRIPPISHQTKKTNVHIMQNGEVCIEFIQENIFFIVSMDGRKIEVSSPTEDWINNTYKLENLPKFLRKKYKYAKHIVDSARSKTPKVEYCGNSIHCSLMENDPWNDFEVLFLKKQLLIRYLRKQSKIQVLTAGNVKLEMNIIYPQGFELYDPVVQRESILTFISDPDQASIYSNELIQIPRYLRKCLKIEKRGSERLSRYGCDPFPIVENFQRTPTKRDQRNFSSDLLKTVSSKYSTSTNSSYRSSSMSWSLSEDNDRIVNTSNNTNSTPSPKYLRSTDALQYSGCEYEKKTNESDRYSPQTGNTENRKDWDVLFA
eukprot:gb/GECH01012583.1/.p1 GENE.gb/GECH01012583.1/~~gb/GECH01012583.1/.p1  ORF type:complete len:618 (+),score=124.59 gb/GECH01012583.1/:1-1854(+)